MKTRLLPLITSLLIPCVSCSKDNSTDDSHFTEGADVVDEKLSEFLDGVPAENFSRETFILQNGISVFDCMRIYDTAFVKNNPWINEFECGSTKVPKGLTGNAGIINLKNIVISNFLVGSGFYLNDKSGIAVMSEVRNHISTNNQKGLWYKWGGKKWNKYSCPSEKPKDNIEKAYYGLDCSGLVYASLNKIGFHIPEISAPQYYDSLEMWNRELQSYVKTKTQFPEIVQEHLVFEKYEYSADELCSKIQPGDILFLGTSNVTHIGIVTSDGLVSQSNGDKNPPHAEDNCPPKRGPHYIPVSSFTNRIWNTNTFGVFRLVADLDYTHWKLKIRCSSRETYITTFDIEIQMDDDNMGGIIPINTVGYDYDGKMCDVTFEGKYDKETQILTGNISKNYGFESRIDGFSVQLTDDTINDIVMNKILSNGGCENRLDLENIDNPEKNPINIKSKSMKTTPCRCEFDSKYTETK